MSGFALLAALDGGAIGSLVAVIFIVISVLVQLAAKMREVQQGPVRPGSPPPQPRRDPLTDEIEKFLKEAQRRRPGPVQPGAARPVPGRPARPQGPYHPQGSSPSQGPATPQGPAAARPRDEVVQAEVIDTVADHVRTHVPAAHFGHLGSELGREVKDVDARMEEHLHNVFDHRLGRLAGSEASAVEPSAAAPGPTTTGPAQAVSQNIAANLVVMLSRPDGVRQAVLVSEILGRPEQRWVRERSSRL